MSAILVRSLAICTCILSLISCVPISQDNTMNVPEVVPTMVDEELPINQFTTAFQNAYNAHDPALVADLYAEDARWMAAAGLVIDGRTTITQFLQQFMIFVPPVLTLDETGIVVTGDYAVTRGIYTMSDGTDKEGRSIGGSYLNVLHKDSDAWRIIGQQMNYDFAMMPLMWVGSLDAVAGLPKGGTLGGLLDAYESDYNAGDATKLATRFAADAWVSFGGSSPVTGRDAAAQALQERIADEHRLYLHDVSTLMLDDSRAVDVGWYEVVADGEREQWGTYTFFARLDVADEWQIHWFIDTGSPSE